MDDEEIQTDLIFERKQFGIEKTISSLNSQLETKTLLHT